MPAAIPVHSAGRTVRTGRRRSRRARCHGLHGGSRGGTRQLVDDRLGDVHQRIGQLIAAIHLAADNRGDQWVGTAAFLHDDLLRGCGGSRRGGRCGNGRLRLLHGLRGGGRGA